MTSTNKPITRIAKLQAAIIAYLKHRPGAAHTAADFAQHSVFVSMELRPTELNKALQGMTASGQLKRVPVKREDQPHSRWAYELGDETAVATRRPRDAKRPSVVVSSADKMPFASISLVKSTKKIRIEFEGGIVIEIGVAE